MDLKEMLGKKKSVDPDVKEAKLKAIKEMRGVASSMMGDGLKDHMAKATVVAKNPRELEEGLDKAKKVVAKIDPSMMEEDEEQLHEDLDGDDEENEPAEHVAKVEADQDEVPALDTSGEEESENEEEHDDHPLVEMVKSPEHAEELIRKLQEKHAKLSRKA